MQVLEGALSTLLAVCRTFYKYNIHSSSAIVIQSKYQQRSLAYFNTLRTINDIFNSNMKKTAFSNIQTKPKLGMMQGKAPQNNVSGKPSLAQLMNQYEEHDYSTISLKLNNEAKLQMQMDERPQQQGLLGFDKDCEDWAALRRPQSPFRSNKENINDQGGYRKKSINEVNRFADCVRELEKNRQDHDQDEQELIGFQPRVTKSPLRGRNVAPTSGLLKHVSGEEELVFRAKAPDSKNINFSELAKRFNGEPTQSQPPQKSARSRSKLAPKIQKQFQESDESEQDSEAASLKESIREQREKIGKGNLRPDQMEELEKRVNQIKETNLRALAEKKQANGNKVLPKLIEDMKANVAREIEEFARSYIEQESAEQTIPEPARPKPTIQPTFHQPQHFVQPLIQQQPSQPQPVPQPAAINPLLNTATIVHHQPTPHQVAVEDPSKKKIIDEAKWQIKEYIETKQKKSSFEEDEMKYGTQPSQVLKPAAGIKITSPPNSQLFSFEQQPSMQMVRNQTLKTISEERSQVTPSDSKCSFSEQMEGNILPKMIESEWPRDPRKSKAEPAPPIQNIELIVSTDFHRRQQPLSTPLAVTPIEDSIIHAIVPPRDRLLEEQQFIENQRLAEQRRLEDARREREEWERDQLERRRREEARIIEQARATEQARAAEESRAAEERRSAEERRLSEEATAAEQARLRFQQQEAAIREQARLRDEERIRQEEIARRAIEEEARAREEARLREEERTVEEERVKEEVRQRLAEEARLKYESEAAERSRLEADADAERRRIEAERFSAARIEAERLEMLENERQQAERDRIERERLELERKQREMIEKMEAGRLQAERERREREEQERIEFERAEALRIEGDRLEQERIRKQQQAEQERRKIETEKLEAERIRRETERFELERQEKQRIERLEAEFTQAQKLQAERIERERREKEQAERERIEAEQREIETRRRQEEEKIRIEEERMRIQKQKREEEERIRAQQEKVRAEQQAKREATRLRVLEQERLLKKQMEEEAKKIEEERAKLQAEQKAKKASQSPEQAKQDVKSSIKLESLFTNYSIYNKDVASDLPPEERINKLFDTARNDKPLGGMDFKFDFGLDLDLGPHDDITGSKDKITGFGKRR